MKSKARPQKRKTTGRTNRTHRTRRKAAAALLDQHDHDSYSAQLELKPGV